MKLYTWPSSPFGAKVWAVALATGMDKKIEKVAYHPWQDDLDLSKLNPLNKIPVLQINATETLYDSPVICQYLIDLSKNQTLTENLWLNLRQQALADGMMTAGATARYETHFRPEALQSKDWIGRQFKAINQSFKALNREQLSKDVTLGNISIAIAFFYLDLRFKETLNWRDSNKNLADWFEAFSQHSCIQQSKPVDAPIPGSVRLLAR